MSRRAAPTSVAARALVAALCLAPIATRAPAAAAAGRGVTIGSKAFAESWILGDALASEMRAAGVPRVEHRRNLGGTEIVLQALRSGDVDVYPEYTGTIQEVIVKSPGTTDPEAMRRALAALGLGMSDPIGFDDSYAVAVTPAAAERYGLHTISDLAKHPEIRLGLTHEFLGRADGFPGLAARYGLSNRNVTGIQHELAYAALMSGRIDGTDIYTTDAQIERLGLRILEDDRRFFPRYDAVWLYRIDLARREPRAMQAIRRLTGTIDRARMIRANARVVLGGVSAEMSADSLLDEIGAPAAGGAGAPGNAGASGVVPVSRAGTSRAISIARNTAQHLKLVALSLLAAVLIGIPLGIAAARSRWIGGTVLAVTGLAQTIPSLALLAVLIPLLGIGVLPALVALFIYSLLPIVRNTYVGLTTIPPPLLESASCLPLSGRTQLLRIRLPLAAPAILAGIRTSAVINVGSATLAALIGAGGLGEPILTGIQLRRTDLILEGAVPAALLALLVERGFDWIERLAVPRGLRPAASARRGLGRQAPPDSSRIGGDSTLEADHDKHAPIERNP
ncbi:MAG: glycine betaine ABC transporter substrate-binding protein [Bacteroidota bacterium]